ncbi:MAG: ATP-binding protein [Proteobacteria bacterium]|nr:ATP-binding protein [Pseudomonadota bacterium]
MRASPTRTRWGQGAWPYAAILALGLTIGGLFFYKHATDLDQLETTYLAEKHLATKAVAVQVEATFKALYQGLRTMSLLPGVKAIDRHGTNFQPDSQLAMQQIYNNTYLNVALSEVYLLPVDFDPVALDATTGKPEAPILTFDEFISAEGTKGKDHADPAQELEEVELFEYHLMRSQLAYLRTTFPTQRSIHDLAVPAVTGHPVVTCDNSEFTKADLAAGNDAPRQGLVYTLPVYDAAGEFHGGVSGVVRLAVLERILPRGSFALVNTTHGYRGVTDPIPELTASVAGFTQGRPNPALRYSEIHELGIVDTAPWQLWIVAPNDEFTSRPAVHQANLIFAVGVAVSVLLMLGLALAVRSAQRHQRTLELKVRDKTRELQVRNDDLRLILDNAEEGFLTCAPDGSIGPEYSAVVARWFGTPTRDTRIWEFVAGDALDAFWLGWDQLVGHIMPFELAVGQMPTIVHHGARHYGLTFTPIYGATRELVSVLVVVVDQTARVEAERRNRHQQELLSTFQAVSRDRAGFLEYFADAERIVRALEQRDGLLAKEVQFRLLHTLKGNSASYGLTTIVDVCHDLEWRLEEELAAFPREVFQIVTDTWEQTSIRIITLIGVRTSPSIELDVADYTHVLQRIKAHADHDEIAALIERWRLERIDKRLARLAEQARSLAARLGVDDVTVTTSDGGIRMEPDSFGDVWSSLTHVVRNAIDHGFARRPQQAPTLHLTTSLAGDALVISVRDNGAGINWPQVRARATSLGLPCASQADLERALFADGLSTQDEVTAISGRGVGMAATRAAVLACGGTIHVVSEPGHGTELLVSLPMPTSRRVALVA